MKSENWKPKRRTENWILKEGRAVIFDDMQAIFNYLNETGTEIWILCEGKLAVGDIVEKIMEKYESRSPHLVKKDLNEFLGELKKQHLVI